MSIRLRLFLALGIVAVATVLWWERGKRGESVQKCERPVASPFAIGISSTVPATLTASATIPPLPSRERSDDVTEFLNMARNAAIDADEREKRIMELGQQGGADAIRKLSALGNADTYFNFAALNALSAIIDPDVATYLQSKLTHSDPRMVAAAVTSLAKVQGAEAVPQIALVLERNRRRDDGFQDIVCTACVNAFKNLRASSALPALALELEKTVGVTLHYEYGSTVVSAIDEIGDPAGVGALHDYIERLRALKASNSDDPKSEHYIQSKIDEALAATERLQPKK